MSTSLPTCLGVIPARGGSKGIIDKNICPFAGSSLLAIAIATCTQAQLLTTTIVSTDSERIATAARRCGGRVPFVRPASISGDDVPIWEVAVHAGRWFEGETGKPPDLVASLQPTSPLRTSAHIDDGIRLMRASDADALMAVTEAEHTPFKMRRIEAGMLRNLLPGQTVGQRQDAPAAYRLNGILYLTRWRVLVQTQSLWGHGAIPMILPAAVGANIDTPLDFDVAEYLYLKQHNLQPPGPRQVEL